MSAAPSRLDHGKENDTTIDTIDTDDEPSQKQRGVRGIFRVSPRESIVQLRGDNVISVGASYDLMQQMQLKFTPQSRRASQQQQQQQQQRRHQSSSFSSDNSSNLDASFTSNTSTSSTSCATRKSYISLLVEDIHWAFRELGYNDNDEEENNNNNNNNNNATSIDLMQVEAWALFLHEILTTCAKRKFHDVFHVYEISAGASPLQFLSAAFRDTIRYYANGDETGQREGMLVKDVVNVSEDGKVVLSADLVDTRDLLVADIFGLQPGQVIVSSSSSSSGGEKTDNSHNGQHGSRKLDLFLSAICAARLLGDHLSLKHIAQLATCVEATTPFRPGSTSSSSSLSSSLSPPERLLERLCMCNAKYSLQMTQDEMVETIQQAVDLRNRTVGNMVSDDMVDFIDHTWNLLPERNTALRKSTLHTLSQYYEALCNTLDVMKHISPHAVIGSFRECPSAADIQNFRRILTLNLKKAVLYTRARVLAVATVVALATLTSGNGAHVPKSFFFGDLPAVHRDSERLGDGLSLLNEDDIPDEWRALAKKNTNESSSVFLEEESNDSNENENDADADANDDSIRSEIYDLLRGTRMRDTGFDTRNAPLSAYMYKELHKNNNNGNSNTNNTAHILSPEHESLYTQCPMTAVDSWKLLRALPLDLVQTVGDEVGRIAISRRKAIGRVLHELKRTTAAIAEAEEVAAATPPAAAAAAAAQRRSSYNGSLF